MFLLEKVVVFRFQSFLPSFVFSPSWLHVRVTDLTHFKRLTKNVVKPTTKVLCSGKWHRVVFIHQNLTGNRVSQKPREAKKGSSQNKGKQANGKNTVKKRPKKVCVFVLWAIRPRFSQVNPMPNQSRPSRESPYNLSGKDRLQNYIHFLSSIHCSQRALILRK